MLIANATLRLGSIVMLSFLAAPGELKLKEAEHKSLSKLVGTYFTAKGEEKGISEAMEKVVSQVEATEKRLKGEKLLASVGDWEQVFRLVAEDRLKEGLKKRGEVVPIKLHGEIDVSVAYCVPKKPAKGALPLILCACGEGETPAAHLDANWNDPALREAAILVAVDLGKDPQSWSVFGSAASPGGIYMMMTALAKIQEQFAVDNNRRYLVGSGKGFAAVEVTATFYPQIFAGLIGIGDVAAADMANLENFRNLPTLFLKGGDGAKAIEAKLGELGFGNCKLEPEGGVAKAWEWIGKTPRAAYPAHLTFVPRFDNSGAAHWVSLVGFQTSEHPRVDAKADKATNTITIDAEKVADIVVFLNDELVDLEKPVKFVVNGTTHESKVERNTVEMINNQFWGGDWGRVFSAFVTQDVPATK
jgi:hypothetical protein